MFYLLEISTKCTVDLKEFSKLVNDEISLPGIQIYFKIKRQVDLMPKHSKETIFKCILHDWCGY